MVREQAVVEASDEQGRPVRVEIDEDAEGAYLLSTMADGSVFDSWHPSVAEAKRVALEAYGVLASAWAPVTSR